MGSGSSLFEAGGVGLLSDGTVTMVALLCGHVDVEWLLRLTWVQQYLLLLPAVSLPPLGFLGTIGEGFERQYR